MIRDRSGITVKGTITPDGKVQVDTTLPLKPGPVEVTVRPVAPAEGAGGKPLTPLDMAGVGAEMWQRIDVDKYLQDLRDEWDRPIG